MVNVLLFMLYSKNVKKLITTFSVTVAVLSACGGSDSGVKDCVRAAMFKNVNDTSGLDFGDPRRASIEQMYVNELSACGVTEAEAREIMRGG
jgi:hypothetical protein